MKRSCHHISGFTMVEIMVSTVILSLALTAAISGWLYVFRGEKLNSVQNELDMDVRSAMERLRADIRLSSIDKMYYYPAGPGPYTAISLPLARDDNGDGLLELDGSGKIIWDKTVIYHVWAGTPNELRKTTFDPRNTNRTPAEMQAQINSVVLTGNGSATYDSSTATTMPLFKNLFNWDIYGKGAQYDAYRPMLTRDANVVFGSALLTPGNHSLTFKVVGKNAASKGFKVGVDSLVMSPCGVPREAEAQTVSASVGATAVGEFMGGSWNGCYQMSFPATATGQYFTLSMENDRWEETNFRGDGSICDNTRIDFEEAYTPKTFVARCVPPTTNWYASKQTLNETFSINARPYPHFQGAVVRVPIRGADNPVGGSIDSEGPLRSVRFRAGATSLSILDAYIAEAADSTAITPDTKPGTAIRLNGADITVGTSASLTIQSGSLYIRKDKTYIVSFMIGWGHCDPAAWIEMHPALTNPPAQVWGSYYITHTNGATIGDLTADVWTAKTNVTFSSELLAVESLYCLAPTNGTWTSQIVDTHLVAPTYTTLTWNEDKPSGTTLKMKVRTGNNEDMSDATVWSSLTAMTGGGAINPASRRYVQVQSEMSSDSTRYFVSSLKDFTVKWNGESRVADIGGTIAQTPSNGVFEILLDGSNIIKRGVTVDLSIFQWVRGFSPGPVGSNILVSTVSAEVEPRNSGK